MCIMDIKQQHNKKLPIRVFLLVTVIHALIEEQDLEVESPGKTCTKYDTEMCWKDETEDRQH